MPFALYLGEMKSEIRITALILGVAVAIIVAGCCDECDDTVLVVDNFPPSPPDGVTSVTGDGVVTLFWNPNGELDLGGYAIYYNYDGGDLYTFLAEVPRDQTWYDDYDVRNGFTKFYAVSAFDIEGLESELSYEVVFDTPRPEGANLVLYDYLGQNSDLSGYDFSSLSGSAQAWNDPQTDVYFGVPGGVYTLFAADAGVDIQDYGYAESFDEVGWAPQKGWTPSGKVEVIPGHIYIVRILSGSGYFNYAKVHITELTPDHATMDWAYQTDPDNPELAPEENGPAPEGGKRDEKDRNARQE